MTREEKITTIFQKLDKLDTEQLKGFIAAIEKIVADDKYKQLRFILGRQPIPIEYFDTIKEYVQHRKADDGFSDVMLYMDLFNFGMMCGKQAERARKRGQQNG